MDANELFNQVRAEVFDLLETGEMEIFDDEYLIPILYACIKSDNEIEVEHNGKKITIECNNFNNTEYVARLIMHCFAKLYLGK